MAPVAIMPVSGYGPVVFVSQCCGLLGRFANASALEAVPVCFEVLVRAFIRLASRRLASSALQQGFLAGKTDFQNALLSLSTGKVAQVQGGLQGLPGNQKSSVYNAAFTALYTILAGSDQRLQSACALHSPPLVLSVSLMPNVPLNEVT